MDKSTPKADLFKANLDRAAPLLAGLNEDGSQADEPGTGES